jgi:hypothetical protein
VSIKQGPTHFDHLHTEDAGKDRESGDSEHEDKDTEIGDGEEMLMTQTGSHETAQIG